MILSQQAKVTVSIQNGVLQAMVEGIQKLLEADFVVVDGC